VARMSDASTGRPVSGTQEWAATNVNIQKGCEHDCTYCYAKSMAVRMGRSTAGGWASPLANQRALGRRFRKRSGTIMFPSSHDITPSNIGECLAVLTRMLEAGNHVLIVTKPDSDCVERLCRELEPHKGRILFRFTIGSADDAILKRWEPGAPSFARRLAALQHAHARGFATSVSCEPMLDARVDKVVEAVRPFVTDAVWIGKANRLRHAVRINAPGNEEAMRWADELLATQTDGAIRDLYARFQADPLIKWKDSIKKVVGLARPTQRGLDV